jgi:hypothetical protein
VGDTAQDEAFKTSSMELKGLKPNKIPDLIGGKKLASRWDF